MPLIAWYFGTGPSDLEFETIEKPNEVTVSDLEKVQSFREISDNSGLDHIKFLQSYFGYLLDDNVSEVNYKGSLDAGFVAEQFAIQSRQESLYVDENRIFDTGVILSTGGYPIKSGTLDGLPVLIGNSSDEFSVAHGTSGDADLDKVINNSFDGAGSTQDASVVEFDLTVDDPNVDTLRASLVFGSDEFPEFSGTQYVDIAGFFVNGVNHATFNSTGKPLSVLSENTTSGVFTENSRAEDLPNSSSVISGEYGIEWDGFTSEISIRAPVEQGVNTIKIAIADTGDANFDSGLYIGDMSLSSGGATGTGVLNVVTPDDTGTATASVAAEEFVLENGAGSTISGSPGDFDGDVVTGFDSSDSVTFLNTLFGVSDVTFSSGSVIMDIDTDADGDPDTNLTFAGQDDPDSFVFSQVGGSTEIGIGPTEDQDGETITGGAADDTLEGTVGNDTIDGGAGFDTALYSGDQNSYTLTLSPTATTVTDRRADGNGTDTLINMEFLDFDSGDFDLNQFGGTTGLSEQNFESFIELYIAYFNRAPDAIGLNFWGTAFANGTSLEEMAALFAPQDETLETYPPGTSNEDFATAVYNSVLGRDPDLDGFNFWVGQLDEGNFSRDQFIREVLQGVQNGSPDRDYLDDKVDIGAYFAVHKGMSDVADAAAAMELFGDQDTADTIGAVAAIDGYHADALDPTDGEFLMPLVGVLDNPFAMA